MCLCCSGSCSTTLKIEVVDFLSPADLKLCSNIDFILDVSAASQPPTLSRLGVPKPRFRVSSTSCLRIKAQLDDSRAKIMQGSLEGALADSIKILKAINSQMRDAVESAEGMKNCHTRGVAAPQVSESLKTVLLSALEAELKQIEVDMEKAAKERQFVTAEKFQKNLLLLQEQVNGFKKFHSHVAEMQTHVSKARKLLTSASESVKTIQKMLPKYQSSVEGIESGLATFLQSAEALINLTTSEFMWIADASTALQTATSRARDEIGTQNLGAVATQLSQKIQIALNAIDGLSVHLSSLKNPSKLQQQFLKLKPLEWCSLVETCFSTGKELELLTSTVLQENNQTTSLAFSHCDSLVNMLNALPVLPKALTFNEDTGMISGIPRQLVKECNYTVTAYNIGGEAAPATACL